MRARVRSSTLTGFIEAVETLGGDAVEILETCGLAGEQLNGTERWIDFGRVLLCYEQASVSLNEPGFGLKLADHRELDYLGPMLLWARHAQTLGEALNDIARALSTRNTGFTIRLDPQQGGSRLHLVVLDSLRPFADQWVEESMATSVRFMRELIGDSFVPSEVAMRHGPLGSALDYESAFGCAPSFEAELDCLTLSQGDVETLNPRRDRATHRFLSDYFAGRLQSSDEVIATTATLVEELLPLGRADLSTVARATFQHPRTLQRQLRSRGATFASILDDRRRAVAERLLVENELSIFAVARAVGYSEQSSFNHAFRRWHNQTPTAWLANQQR